MNEVSLNGDSHIEAIPTIKQKALRINLNENIYGTFAEIGAGQETARQFFRVGGASGTIAKAMSALPVGFAYSTYSGLTVTGVVLFAVLKFNQVPNLYGTIGIILIIIGVVMVNYLGRLT